MTFSSGKPIFATLFKHQCMNSVKIYMNDWLDIHPYNRQQPSDPYFVNLANTLYATFYFNNVPPFYHKKLCIYVAAYFEDIISGPGLWHAFTQKHQELYGRLLPFYTLNPDYQEEEVNEEDIRFIIWNTLIKIPGNQSFTNPLAKEIEMMAHAYYEILHEEYESAPANDFLTHYLDDFTNRNDGNYKLLWLFGRNYLMQPSVQEFLGHVTPSDKFIIPCGPLALFLYEWITLLAPEAIEKWKEIEGLFPSPSEMPEEYKTKNKEIYEHFTAGTNGERIVYLNGYAALHDFLVNILKWPDDESHTMPQLKSSKDFILMTDPEKGILLAKDLCPFIADPLNPMYNSEEASKNAFRLITEPTLCPPDLLHYLLANHYLPDLQLPGNREREMVEQNADFIARHTLLYYYRGD